MKNVLNYKKKSLKFFPLSFIQSPVTQNLQKHFEFIFYCTRRVSVTWVPQTLTFQRLLQTYKSPQIHGLMSQ